MATRSIIKFNNGVCIYRHWDGYPSRVLSDLRDILLKGVRTYDTEYFIGGFLQQIGAKEQKRLDNYYTKDYIYLKYKDYEPSNEMRNAVLSYGVFYSDNEKELDYGQEYAYYFNEKEVKCMSWNFERCFRKFKYSDLIEMSEDDIKEATKRYE